MNIFDAFQLSIHDCALQAFLTHCLHDSDAFTRQLLYEAAIDVDVDATLCIHSYAHMQTVAIVALHERSTDVTFLHFDNVSYDTHTYGALLQQLELPEATQRIVYIGEQLTQRHTLSYDIFLQSHWTLENTTLQLIFEHFQQKIRAMF